MPSIESILLLGAAIIAIGGIYIFSDSLVGDTRQLTTDAKSAQSELIDLVNQ